MNYESKMDLSGMTEHESASDDVATEERSARKRKIIVAVVVAAAMILAAAYMLSHSGEETAFGAAEDGTTPVVTVVTPGSETLQGTINANGSIAARREMPVGVTGEGGRVVSVNVDQGDWVEAGQVLAVIDRSVQTQQTRTARAQVEIARADGELAQQNLDRALQLVERGFISQADIDRLTATRDAARARVDVAEAQLGERQARNDQLNIVAPAAGLVLSRNVEPGQTVGAGSGTLFSIARGGQMELLARLGEEDLAAVSVGVPATVTPVGTEQSFSGQVWQISPMIDETDRQGTARIALDYAPGLRPGGFASVQINAGSVVAPKLPESAILSDDSGSYVLIVGENDTVVRRDVELGMITGDGIAIASGLEGDEQVVVRAGGFLTEGETIRPVREGSQEADAPADGEG